MNKKIFIKIIFILTIFYIFLILFFVIFQKAYYCDLILNFSLYFILFTVLLMILHIFFKKKVLTFLLFAIFLIQIILVFNGNRLILKKNIILDNKTIKVLSYNVFIHNSQKKEILDIIKNNEPDFIFLYEIDEKWVKFLKNNLSKYYKITVFPDYRPFGIALLTKEKTESKILKDENLNMGIKINIENNISLYGIHIVPPLNKKLFLYRNKQLKILAKDIANNKSNSILVFGDFNSAIWSYYLKNFAKQAKLKKVLFSLWTWHGLKILYLPIDNVFYKNIKIRSIKRLDTKGSDHKPLLISF